MTDAQRAELNAAWAFIAELRATVMHLRLLAAELEELQDRVARLTHERPARIRLH